MSVVSLGYRLQHLILIIIFALAGVLSWWNYVPLYWLFLALAAYNIGLWHSLEVERRNRGRA